MMSAFLGRLRCYWSSFPPPTDACTNLRFDRRLLPRARCVIAFVLESETVIPYVMNATTTGSLIAAFSSFDIANDRWAPS